MSIDIVRVPFEGELKMRHRLRRLSGFQKVETEVGVGIGIIWIEAEGVLYTFDGFGNTAGSRQRDAQVNEGEYVVRINRQDRFIFAYRIIQAARIGIGGAEIDAHLVVVGIQ